ncbi:MAG TPA: hypothetical protein VFD77_00450 [Brumimicrobium sp.]|nr:hypothetical protein [Brumimicrobium sp.]
MKTTLKLLLVIFLLTSAGCSKYEEGSFFTIKTKKGRITNTWEPVKYVYSDGSSSTDVVPGKITLDKDMSASVGVEYNGSLVSVPGTWRFINDKEGINITVSLFTYSDSRDYEIVKLKSKELWVRDKDQVVTHFKATD